MRINELVLEAVDLERQRAFYVEALGLPVLDAPESMLCVGVGSGRLVFRQGPGAREGGYHYAFTIPENQIQAARAWLAERAALLADAAGNEVFFFEGWDAHAIYCLDPDGNIIELIARHTLANPSDAPFDPSQILGISEIGVVATDVPALAAALQTQTGTGVYGVGGPTFTALGDHHGLLILVPPGRTWFPTRDHLATPLPLRVTVEPGGDLSFEC
ncbi:MAG TPA: VOC family protein [Roseiflexaceae bacterium]|nr:VOC family protein [Roseiflexaceae bacterium]